MSAGPPTEFAILLPLIERLGTARLHVHADDDPCSSAPKVDGPACRLEDLAAYLRERDPPDLLRIGGRPGRHHIVAVGAAIAAVPSALARTSVLVEQPPERGLAPGADYRAVAAAIQRERTADEVLTSALMDLPGSDGRAIVGLPRGPRLSVARAARPAVADLLPTLLPLLSRVAESDAVATQRKLDALALAEDLRRAQRAGEKVVRSLRFRIGTRIVRAGRRLLGRTATFRAPREVLALAPVVTEWSARLDDLRPQPPAPLKPGAPRITFVLPELRLSGGAIVVAELVDEMRLLGADARIETLQFRADAAGLPLLTTPRVHASPEALAANLERCDVVVATHWTTAAWVDAAVRTGRADRAAAYLQDYEPWFVPEADTAGRARVRAAIALISDRFVTSQWLADRLAADGFGSVVAPPGLDLTVFSPRPSTAGERPLVLAMARPRTPRRGFETVVAALDLVHRTRPDVRIMLFGENLGTMPLPFPCDRIGVVTDQDELSKLLASATVHYDGSDFQAFGRTTLEAMACGTPSVITAVGGAGEYARDGENALVVPPRDPETAATAILQFISDQEFRRNASAAGLAVVPEFSVRRRARALLDHLADHA